MTIIIQPKDSQIEGPNPEMSFDLYHALEFIRDINVNHAQKAVLFALASRANKEGKCFPGMDTVARDAGFRDKKTVGKHIQSLAVKGVIEVQRRDNGFGKHTSNLYTLTGLLKPTHKVGKMPSTGSVEPPSNYTETNYKVVNSGLSLKDPADGLPPSVLITTKQKIKGMSESSKNNHTDGLITPEDIYNEEEIVDRLQLLEMYINQFVNTKLTHKAVVYYWYSLMSVFYNIGKNPKLPKYQWNALKEILINQDKKYLGVRNVLRVIGYAITEWHVIVAYSNCDTKPPQAPTLVFIRDHMQEIVSYLISQGEVILGDHEDD